jgi:DMSO/TMAO reductase YedYZ molybdopterin-dependent catalytic subunit
VGVEYVMDSCNDVMLAWGMNGEVLSPDHGFPLRVVIPGFIGGRMVKWVKSITIGEVESDSYYHFHDNRVLPSIVTDHDMALKEGWWRKPEYIINERYCVGVMIGTSIRPSCTRVTTRLSIRGLRGTSALIIVLLQLADMHTMVADSRLLVLK